MLHKVKKLLSCLLAVAMLVASVSVAFAAETDQMIASTAGDVTLSATSISKTTSTSQQTDEIYVYIDKNIQIGSAKISYQLSGPDDKVSLQTGVGLGSFSDALVNQKFQVSNAAGKYPTYDANLKGYGLFKLPISIAADAVGEYSVTFTVDVLADADYEEDYSLTKDSITSTISVKAPSSPYEIYYELNSTIGDTMNADAASGKDKYMEYAYDNGENAVNQVEAELWLVSNDADMTLQAYDVYLDYNENLIFNEFKPNEVIGAGIAYQTVQGATYVSDILAEAGDVVTHIQAVGENDNDDGNKTVMNPVSLAKGEAVSLGTIVFDIDPAAEHDEELKIELIDGTSGTNVTNVALANGIKNVTGDKASYYPVALEGVLGAEVKQEYTVEFVDAAATETTVAEEQTIGRNLTATEPDPDPEKDNHTFDGWYSDEACTKSFDFTTPITGDTTIYANFTQDTFTVTWYGAEEEELEKNTVNSGSDLVVTTKKPEKAKTDEFEYEFIGWNTKPDQKEALTLTGVKVESDLTYYPVYREITREYIVKFVNYDGTELQTSAVAYGETPKYTGSTPERPETAEYTYGFIGWNPTISAVTGEATYTAEYEKTRRSYTVTFDMGGKAENITVSLEYGVAITEPESVPTSQHYTFNGWYSDVDCKTAYDFTDKTVTGPVTIYAGWTPKTYTVTFMANNGTEQTDKQDGIVYNVATPLKDVTGFTAPMGYKLVGWNTVAKPTEENQGESYGLGASVTLGDDLTLYAQWADDPHQVTFGTSENGTVTANPLSGKQGDMITLTPTPDKGYKHVGYTVIYKDESGTEVPVTVTNNAFEMPGADVIVTAAFDPIDYEVEVGADIQNGEVTVSKNPAHYKDTITVTLTPTAGYKIKKGTVQYTYSEDGENKTGTINVTESDGKYIGEFTMPASNVQVNAEFEVITYTIQFNKNADDATGNAIADIQNVAYDASVTLPANTYSLKGYDFKGWSTDPNATTATYEDCDTVTMLTAVDGGVVTLYAVWDEAVYEVVLNTNSGSLAAGDELTSYTFGTGATLPTPTRTGYEFKGWYTDADCTGEAVDKISNTEVGAKVFYAKWEAEDVTVTLDGNGGYFIDGENKESTVDVEIPFDSKYTENNLPQPERDGYEFTGWKTENDEKITDESTVSTLEKHKLIAQWNALPYEITFDLDEGTMPADESWVGDATYENGVLTYTIESTSELPKPTKAGWTFDGWYVQNESAPDTIVGNWGKHDDLAAKTVKDHFGNVTLLAKWKQNATYAVEEYGYANEVGLALLIVPNDLTEENQEYKFGEGDAAESMYFIKDGTYGGADGAFYLLVAKEYLDENEPGKLTDAGYKLLKSGAVSGSGRRTVNYTGDINADQSLNIADANVVYQMITTGDAFYTIDSVTAYDRLHADMSRATTEGDFRSTIADVNKIVNMINGIN